MNYSDVWRLGLVLLLVIGSFPNDRAIAVVSLESSFSVSQSYTSNLFFEDEDEDDDFGTFLGPNFTLLYENPDLVLGATYTGRLSFFVNNPDAGRYSQNANIILDLPFLTKRYRGLTVTIDESMTFTPQLDGFSLSGAEDASTSSGGRNQNSGSATGGSGFGGGAGGTSSGTTGGGLGSSQGGSGVFTRRSNAFNNNAGVTVGYAWSRRILPSVGYTNNYLHFFSGGLQDSLTHNGRTSLSYQFTEQTSVTPSYSYSQTKFIGKSSGSTRGNKIIRHSPSLGFSHALSPSINVAVRGGVTFSKQIGATEQEQVPNPVPPPTTISVTRKIPEKFRRTIVGSAGISKSYTQGKVGINFSQSVSNGVGLAAQTNRSRNVTGRINHALSQRMDAFGSVGWAANDSIDGDAFDTTTYRIQTGLGYTFASWLSGNFYYSHIRQSSSGSAATDLNVDQFFLGFTAVADPWIIYR